MEMMLKTNELCKTFKDQKAVNKVSLNIPKGCVYGLLGPNVHIAELIGRVCEAKRPHSVSERSARALS